VIKIEPIGHCLGMGASSLVGGDSCDEQASPDCVHDDAARIRRLVTSEFDFVWRSLRRLGVVESRAEDAAQEVFLVASRKIGPVAAGRERAFLFAIAVRVAADFRRSRRRHPDVGNADELLGLADAAPLPDEFIDRRQARAVMDALIQTLSSELRTVFVLYELEELSMIQIAELLDLRPGTVASRLRLGREQFEIAMARYLARTGGAK
jgi:RNA polymerase sigma-70 factor, ECF subfamily